MNPEHMSYGLVLYLSELHCIWNTKWCFIYSPQVVHEQKTHGRVRHIKKQGRFCTIVSKCRSLGVLCDI